MLEQAAEILDPLLDVVVFVGGATVHFWITDEAAPPVRATDDVDVICDVTTYSQNIRHSPKGCESAASKKQWASLSSAAGGTDPQAWPST
jgi:hypothetical protein